MKTNRHILYAALILLLVLLSAVSLIVGEVWVPWSAWAWAEADPRWGIVFELRLPRTILGLCVGAALGLSGAALQGYTRNPLADPGILGVSSMAALGAVLTLYSGVTALAPWVLPVAAISGALIGVGMLMALSGSASSLVTFVLAGAVLNILSSAGVSLALSLVACGGGGAEESGDHRARGSRASREDRYRTVLRRSAETRR